MCPPVQPRVDRRAARGECVGQSGAAVIDQGKQLLSAPAEVLSAGTRLTYGFIILLYAVWPDNAGGRSDGCRA